MQKHPSAQVTISTTAQQVVFQDVSHRQQIEACGLLLGHTDEQGNWCVELAHPLRNIANSPVYFEFAPEDLLDAELTYPGKIIGVYHSHPGGQKSASNTDRQNMKRVNVEQRIPWVWLIVSGPFHRFSGVEDVNPSVVGYYHYEQLGLREIAVVVEVGE
jgi:proteasome lid subunit RPN8/RPN11